MLRSIQNSVNTQLKQAFVEGNVAKVESLLAMRADPDILLEVKGCPLIRHAVDNDWLEMTGILIDYGANIHWKDLNGNNLLHVAVHNGSLKMTHLLVNSGINIEDGDNEHNTPLDIAYHSSNHRREYESIINYLLPFYTNPLYTLP